MSSNVRAIDVRSAHIATAQISIRMLTIDKRKVTQSLFRQLPERLLFDSETLAPRGLVWGHVHYFWGDYEERSSARHFVWQHEDVLCRCYMGDVSDVPTAYESCHWCWRHYEKVLAEQRRTTNSLEEIGRSLARHVAMLEDKETTSPFAVRLRESIARGRADIQELEQHDNALSQEHETERREAAFRANAWNALFATLRDLPQLYIAV